MWVLVAVSILIGSTTGVSSISSIRFGTERACETVVVKIIQETKKIRTEGANYGAKNIDRALVFCVHDDYLREQIEGLDKALEKNFSE